MFHLERPSVARSTKNNVCIEIQPAQIPLGTTCLQDRNAVFNSNQALFALERIFMICLTCVQHIASALTSSAPCRHVEVFPHLAKVLNQAKEAWESLQERRSALQGNDAAAGA